MPRERTGCRRWGDCAFPTLCGHHEDESESSMHRQVPVTRMEPRTHLGIKWPIPMSVPKMESGSAASFP